MSPRYDVPNAAPEPLRQVQLFVNSIDRENGVDWLPEWLAERGLEARARPGARSCARRCARSCSRTTALPLERGARRGRSTPPPRGCRLELDEDGPRARRRGGDPLDRIVAIALGAMLDGTLVAAEGVPQLLLVVLRLLAEPLGDVVLDAALRQPHEDARRTGAVSRPPM